MLVVRGEAGVGKSALLGYVETQAGGFRIGRAAGVESEMELVYAGQGGRRRGGLPGGAATTGHSTVHLADANGTPGVRGSARPERRFDAAFRPLR